MGKTSVTSRFNIPGKIGWLTMEAPGFITLLYTMYTLPRELGISESGQGFNGLPWANWTMAGLFVSSMSVRIATGRLIEVALQTVHYLYRAVLYPIITPSMSPIHVAPWSMALAFQVFNALSLGGWLAGYGPRTTQEWAGKVYNIEVGMVLWGWGLLANMYHDDDLREIRRAAARRQAKIAKDEGKKPESVEKVYMMPKNGLFHYILFPHYLCEWVEWAGFWCIGGLGCVPARTFLVNEIATMLPRALQGKRWYEAKFGKERVNGRKAVIPGLL